MGSSREQRSALTLSGKSKEGDKGKLPEDVTSAISAKDLLQSLHQLSLRPLILILLIPDTSDSDTSDTSDSDTPDTSDSDTSDTDSFDTSDTDHFKTSDSFGYALGPDDFLDSSEKK